MLDREKVMKGLSLCKWSNAGLYEGFLPEYEICNKCPYARDDFEVDECCAELMRDALKLLKAQEPVLLKNQHKPGGHFINANSPWKSRCPRCEKKIEGRQTKFCKYCGQAVKWDAQTD